VATAGKSSEVASRPIGIGIAVVLKTVISTVTHYWRMPQMW